MNEMYAIGSMRTGPHLGLQSSLPLGFHLLHQRVFLIMPRTCEQGTIILFFLSMMHFSAQPNFALKAKDTCVTKAALQEESCEWKWWLDTGV